ncbi:MAG TPA: arginine--tRNA ligase, partial [Cytophagales bacterium]|nr:arginine--tRNA ligase [Cytophagales bacterium]
ALVAAFAYDLAKEYNQFYQSISILGETDKAKVNLRLCLSLAVGRALKHSMSLLGIRVPDKM